MAKIEFVMSEAETLVLSMLVSEALTEVGLADGKPLRRVRTKREKELALQLDQRLAGLAGDIRQWQEARKAIPKPSWRRK